MSHHPTGKVDIILIMSREITGSLKVSHIEFVSSVLKIISEAARNTSFIIAVVVNIGVPDS